MYIGNHEMTFLFRYQFFDAEVRRDAQQQINVVSNQYNAEADEQQTAENHDKTHIFLDGTEMTQKRIDGE